MIEETFNLFKHGYLKGDTPFSAKDCHKKVEDFAHHNNNRYFCELFGITPNQVLKGQPPDKHKFKYQISKAASQRRIANQSFALCTIDNC
ncbi:MAG: hypothetical protein K1X55_15250 [Chitinophagales bacterium]|nr:hypothetical protein [Chitinophagales bacterium]